MSEADSIFLVERINYLGAWLKCKTMHLSALCRKSLTYFVNCLPKINLYLPLLPVSNKTKKMCYAEVIPEIRNILLSDLESDPCAEEKELYLLEQVAQPETSPTPGCRAFQKPPQQSLSGLSVTVFTTATSD